MMRVLAQMARAWLAMRQQAQALHVQQTASSLTLLTLLAMVPVASIALVGLTSWPALAPVRRNLEHFIAEHVFLPAISDSVLAHLNTFAAAAERLSALGTLAFLATALMAMLTIDRTLNGIWRTSRPRSLPYRLSLYWALLSLGPVLLGGAIALQLKVVAQLHAWDHVPGWVMMVRIGLALLPASLVWGGLTLVYRLVPNATVRWRDAALGAAVAVVLGAMLKYWVGLYLAWIPTYTLVYGAFAVLPVLLLWLFAVWLSILWGALLAAQAGVWGRLTVASGVDWPPGAWFVHMVEVVLAVVQAYPQPVPADTLRRCFDGDERRAERVLETLMQQGYVLRVVPLERVTRHGSLWDELWLAAPGWETKTLQPLFEHLWGAKPPVAADACGVRAEWLAAIWLRPLAEWVRYSRVCLQNVEAV